MFEARCHAKEEGDCCKAATTSAGKSVKLRVATLALDAYALLGGGVVRCQLCKDVLHSLVVSDTASWSNNT